jgi:hypothetical protein
MKYFVKSVGLSLALGIACSILMIVFIEGWGEFITLFVAIASFGFAGFFVGKKRPKSSIYSGLFISLPFILGFIPDTEDFKLMLGLLSSPSKIDYRNFYVFLPYITLISAYIGIFIGNRISKHSIKIL